MKNTSPHPPRLAQRFLIWFLKEELAEEVMGDLEEQFYATLEEKSLRKARLNYWYQVIFYLRLFAIKTPNILPKIHIPMFKNYILVAWRNLVRHKLYSAIKIGGFAIGMAACFLITLYILDELSYDQQYPDKDRIYRLLNVTSDPTDPARWVDFQPPAKQALEDEIPDLEIVGRLNPNDWFDGGNNQVRPEGHDMTIYEEGFVYADPEFLEILQLPMVYGDAATALDKPNTIVIARSKAEKYFPDQNPIGKTLTLNEDKEKVYEIGGVMEDLPHNTHLEFDFIMTLKEKEFWPGEQTSWCCSNYETFFCVKPGTDIAQLKEKLQIVLEKYIVPNYKEIYGASVADETYKYQSIDLQAIGDVYLKSKDVYDRHKHSDIQIVWMFGLIAGFILLLAVINFINIATAKSANRAKEVGLRKVIGSQRYQLIQHFLTESILYSLAAFVIGLSLINLLIPFFNQLTGKSLAFPWESSWWLFPFLILCVILLGILSGLYPAFYLSGFQPIKVLKGVVSLGSKSSGFRNVLVIFQFTTSMVLVIGALIVHRQMNFILTKKLGYDKDQVLIVHSTNTLGDKMDTFKDELLKLPQIQSVTYTEYLPISGTKRDNNQFWEDGKEKQEVGIGAQIWRVDEDYINTLGMKIIEGRNFIPEKASDSTAMIISQTMAKELGFKDPIGKRVTNGFMPTFHIIGVIEDFHFESIKGEIRPLSLYLGQGGTLAAVKIKASAMNTSIEAVKKVWDQFVPKQNLRYSFMDERYARMYDDVQRTGRIFDSFAVLAIIVACIGLFALSSFMAEQRRKEICIRKVLGAPISSLFRLMTFRFLRLVLISLLIAIPLSWYLMQSWLDNYEYRISIRWDIFVYSGLAMFLIALFTISYESIRVIRINPAENLQAE